MDIGENLKEGKCPNCERVAQMVLMPLSFQYNRFKDGDGGYFSVEMICPDCYTVFSGRFQFLSYQMKGQIVDNEPRTDATPSPDRP